MNDLVDGRDMNMGAWFEAQIVNVTGKKKTSNESNDSYTESKLQSSVPEEDIVYHVKYEE